MKILDSSPLFEGSTPDSITRSQSGNGRGVFDPHEPEGRQMTVGTLDRKTILIPGVRPGR